jgi:NAD(P)-dependent dehydrogenase (short-subunit alcohol dehydrogenase family)
VLPSGLRSLSPTPGVAQPRLAELFDLSGKVTIVTGGSVGLGRQFAEALAEAGADIVVCARRPERCHETAAYLEQTFGIRAFGMECDVRHPMNISHVVERAVDEFGHIDILVNNAGTSWGAAAEDYPLEAWQKVIEVNLTGAFLFSQAVGRRMIEQGTGGKIVNLSSIAALEGSAPELIDAVAYHASKGGLGALTRDLAAKWARYGINVNAIAPGWFPTDMSSAILDRHAEDIRARIPLARFGDPHDLKGAIVFLASRASDFVTGQTLVVDGGQSVT